MSATRSTGGPRGPILVCAATRAEAGALRAGTRKCGLAGEYEILTTGMGFRRARRALMARLALRPRPSLIVSSGFAGALTNGISRFSWITASRVFLSGSARELTPLDYADGALRCAVVSSLEVVTERHSEFAAHFMRESGGLLAVDMESGALGALAHSIGVPFMVLRMVTDTPEFPLPPFVKSLAGVLVDANYPRRLRHLASGAASAMTDPLGIVRLVRSGRKWLQLLESGWAHHAPLIRRKLDEFV